MNGSSFVKCMYVFEKQMWSCGMEMSEWKEKEKREKERGKWERGKREEVVVGSNQMR